MLGWDYNQWWGLLIFESLLGFEIDVVNCHTFNLPTVNSKNACQHSFCGILNCVDAKQLAAGYFKF
jgi:hypothetical protein